MENPFDLRAFLAKIDAAGQLRTINGAALDTEVGALTELNGQRQGPALLFGGFEGYPAGYRVLSGAMLNAATFGAALGVDAESDNLAMLRTVSGVMKEVAGRAKDFPVEYVDDGPILENYFESDDVDVTRFPVPLWHPDDGGRYIGAPAASTSTPTRTPAGSTSAPTARWCTTGTPSPPTSRPRTTARASSKSTGTAASPARSCSCPAGIRCSLPWERRTRPTA